MAAAAAEFGTVNFVVMAAFVLATLAIGVYYGLRGGDAQQLLIAHDMGVAPVSLSMMATFLSAILIVGSPSEIFYFGLEWGIAAFTFLLDGTVSAFVFLPIFYRLQLTSVYEYLGMRYGTRFMTVMGTLAFMTQNLLYTGIALYAPSIVLSNVTGIASSLAILLVGLLGASYTAFGGFRAVVWADALQAVVMVSGVLAVIIQGCINVGGFSQMLAVNREHDHLTLFNWTFNPLQRHNFWNVFFGHSMMFISLLSVNQPAVQRLLSLPTYKQAAATSVIGGVLMFAMTALSVTSGLAIFATYAGCDPLRSGAIGRRDELVPHFVSDQLGHVPGLGGLFIACVLSGALSTVSSSLNSLAAVTWEDFIRDCGCTGRLSDAHRRWVLRGIAMLYGILSMGMAFLAQSMGGVLQIATGVYGGCTGPVLGLFCLGLFVPFSNPVGATSGLVVGLVLSLWVSFGASFSGVAAPVMIQTRTDACPYNITAPDVFALGPPVPPKDLADKSPIEIFYSISYMLYSVVGFLSTTITGIIVSALTGGSRIKVDPQYLSPAVRCSYRKKRRSSRDDGIPNDAFEMDSRKTTV